jgi:hypothetical protein
MRHLLCLGGVLFTACTPAPSGESPQQPSGQVERPVAAAKRIAGGIRGAPPAVWDDLSPGTVPGAALSTFVCSGVQRDWESS